MLVETFMARDDNPSFDELVALAVETGREGVKALKAQPVEKTRPRLRRHRKLQPQRNRWARTIIWSLALRELMTA